MVRPVEDEWTQESSNAPSLYLVGGLVIEIDGPYDPLFERATSSVPDIVVRRVSRERVEKEWAGAGDTKRYGGLLGAVAPDGGWLVRFPDWFDAVVEPEGREILVWEPVRWSGLSRSVLTTVVPLAMSCHGRLAFHGSAVALDRASLMLVGETGAGKSTLATALCLEGARLLADDIAYARLGPADEVLIEPSTAATRLFPRVARRMGQGMVDPTGAKQLVGRPFAHTAETPARLAAFSVLGPAADGRGPAVSSLRGADAVVVVLHHMLAPLARTTAGQALQHRLAMAINAQAEVQTVLWAPGPNVARQLARDLIEKLQQTDW